MGDGQGSEEEIKMKFKMRIKITFLIRMRSEVIDPLRTSLILILPLNPEAGWSR